MDVHPDIDESTATAFGPSAAQPDEDPVSDRLELEALLLARTYLYELFFRLTGATPDARMAGVLAARETYDVLDEYARENAPLGALRDIVRAFGGRAREDEGALGDLRDEYTRLFIGPGMLPCPVQESPYLTHENTVMQQDSVDVRRIYHACSLRPVKEQRFPDDHVAMMCSFMAKMAQRARDAFAAGDGKALGATLAEQKGFVAGHMATWLGDFARALRHNSRTCVLYPQLVEGLAVFVQVDAAFCAQAETWAARHPDLATDDATGTLLDRGSLDAVAAALDRLRNIAPLGLDDFAMREL